MTAVQFADRYGFDRAQIWKIEAQRVDAKDETLERLAALLECPLPVLYAQEPNPVRIPELEHELSKIRDELANYERAQEVGVLRSLVTVWINNLAAAYAAAVSRPRVGGTEDRDVPDRGVAEG